VIGDKPADALQKWQAAGFTSVTLGTCTAGSGGQDGSVTGTTPAADSVVNKGTAISVNYKKQACP